MQAFPLSDSQASDLLSLERRIKPAVEALFSIPGVTLARALIASPWALTSTEEEAARASDNVVWLQRRLGLRDGELGTMVNKNAYLLFKVCAR
jgi:hypothetical protein